jgi:hypothetical protein
LRARSWAAVAAVTAFDRRVAMDDADDGGGGDGGGEPAAEPQDAAPAGDGGGEPQAQDTSAADDGGGEPQAQDASAANDGSEEPEVEASVEDGDTAETEVDASADEADNTELQAGGDNDDAEAGDPLEADAEEEPFRGGRPPNNEREIKGEAVPPHVQVTDILRRGSNTAGQHQELLGRYGPGPNDYVRISRQQGKDTLQYGATLEGPKEMPLLEEKSLQGVSVGELTAAFHDTHLTWQNYESADCHTFTAEILGKVTKAERDPGDDFM